MDFLDPVKKRAHTRRLFIGYFLVGVAILMASAILVILSYGYDLDRKTGQVIQNGLIFANAAPDAATIYLNGKENGQTDKRLTVPAGQYNIEYRRQGYRTWKKQIQLDGSSIERLVYARLFPEKLEQAESAVFDVAPAFISQSPDRRWIVASQGANIQTMQVFDTANVDDTAKTISLPAGLLTPAADASLGQLELVEWSSDNRHILVEHIYDDKREFLMIDRQDATASVNLNKVLGVTPSEIVLRDKKFDQLYVYDATAQTLSRANTKTPAVTPLLNQVVSFKPYGADMLLLATKDTAKPEMVQVELWDDGERYKITSYKDTPVLLDMAQFDGDWYVAISPVKEGRVYIYKDPVDRIKDKNLAPFGLLRLADPRYLSFSANTRFLAVQSGASFVSYDFETKRRFSFKAAGEVPVEQKARWMDGHRLVLSQNEKIVVIEFDGANRQELAATRANGLPFFDRDYERLYTVTTAKDDAAKSALTRSSLKLDVEP